jgi:hypothetical protein
MTKRTFDISSPEIMMDSVGAANQSGPDEWNSIWRKLANLASTQLH